METIEFVEIFTAPSVCQQTLQVVHSPSPENVSPTMAHSYKR